MKIQFFTMAPGTNATEIQSSSVVLRPRHRLVTLHEMYPASSETSYDGHVAVHQTCVPACPVLVIKVAAVSTGVSSIHRSVQHLILPA